MWHFADGQIFQAYEFASRLIKSAKSEIALVDNYVDETVLTMLDKRDPGVEATIYTLKISNQFKLDIAKHDAQYPAIPVKVFTKAHDRFLIIDDPALYSEFVSACRAFRFGSFSGFLRE